MLILSPMLKRDIEDFISHWKGATASEPSISQQFARAKPAGIAEILKTLETFGRARKAGDGIFSR